MTDTENLPAQAQTGTALAPDQSMSAASIWSSFQEMVKDPTIDPAKMQTMYELQKTMISDQRQEEFNRSKFAAMANMPTIDKNKQVTDRSGKLMYRYSDFKHLYKLTQPILSAEGLILDFDVSEMEGETKVPFLKVAPILRHVNGYVWQGSYMPVPITAANNAISLTQASKGAVETGKRTTLISCLGITEEEDPSLFKNPSEAIPDGANYDALIDDGRRAAMKGTAGYAAWLKSLTNVQKGWLITNGHHDELTKAAQNNTE